MTLLKYDPKRARDLLVALAVAAAAVALESTLTLWIGWRAPLMVIQPAIIFTAATLGRLPAALVMLIGGLNALWAFPPVGSWKVNDPVELLTLGAYLVIGGLSVVYGGRLHLQSSRAERAERRLRLAQDETGVGLFELDYQAGTAYATPALCQILGQPVMEGSMPLEQWLAGLHAGHVDESYRTLQQKIATGELRYERELRVILPDGNEHWLLSRIRLELDAHGQLARSRGATLDITARKQLVTELEAAQAQLRQQLDDLSRLHDLSSKLLAMPALDAALQAIQDAVCSFHDVPVGVALGVLRLCEPGGGSRRVAHTGLSADALAQFAAFEDQPQAPWACSTDARSAGRIVVEDIQHDERCVALRPLAQTLGARALHSTPLRASGDGRLLGVLTVLMAETGPPSERVLRLTDLCVGQAAALIERDQALSVARDVQRRFEVALQSSSVAFTILSPVRDEAGRTVDFVWTYANPAAAAMIDRPVQDLIGKRILDVLPHAWDEPGFFERYVKVSEEEGTAEFETPVGGTGRTRWLHVILSPLNGSVVVWFADITQRREQQQALHDADRRKDLFLATLAHELRNPLAPIRNAAAIMRLPGASEAQREWSLAVIERQLQHMALLLDDLLDISRITRGSLPLRRARSALRPIVETAIETARPLFDTRRHQLVLELPDEPVWLDVDPLRIAQVLGNLLVNAAKYTQPPGEVRVTARREAGEVVLEVTDNGSGLSPEDCERVFEMFTQVASAGRSSQSGLGIGLALARSLVQLHGGRLDARSPGLGLGCTFTVRLPASIEATDIATAAVAGATGAPSPERVGVPDAAGAATPGHAPAAHRRRILVADDNRDAADSLALLLGMEGHDVQVVYDGSQALARFRAFRPHVALLDLSMPGQSGAEVAASIRREEQGDPVTLVAITGLGQPHDRQTTLQAGFDHHLTKPIEIEQLQRLIHTATINAG